MTDREAREIILAKARLLGYEIREVPQIKEGAVVISAPPGRWFASGRREIALGGRWERDGDCLKALKMFDHGLGAPYPENPYMPQQG